MLSALTTMPFRPMAVRRRGVLAPATAIAGTRFCAAQAGGRCVNRAVRTARSADAPSARRISRRFSKAMTQFGGVFGNIVQFDGDFGVKLRKARCALGGIIRSMNRLAFYLLRFRPRNCGLPAEHQRRRRRAASLATGTKRRSACTCGHRADARRSMAVRRQLWRRKCSGRRSGLISGMRLFRARSFATAL